jgi:hypothetical protein
MKMTLQVFCFLALCVLGITSGFKDDSQAGNHGTICIRTVVQGGAEKRENLKLEKHEGNFKTLFAPETVFYKSGNFINTHKKNPWSESASELYRPSDRRLSAT